METLGLTQAQWLEVGLAVAIVLLTAVIGRWLIGVILNQVIRRMVGWTRTELDNLILEALRPSIYLLAVVLAFQHALARLDFLVEPAALDDLFYVLYFAVAFLFVWMLIGRLFSWYGKEIAPRTETNLDEQLIPFFRRVAMIILGVIGLIMLLGHFNVNISALVTTLGIGSLAIALAAQETLSDTLGGFVIMIDRPFRIGDRIEIQALDTWGDIEDIGLRSSRIRTRDNRMVIIPNSVIGKSLIVNHSYPDTQYRIQIHVGLAYGVDIEAARRTMIQAVRDIEGVSSAHPVDALFLEFGESTLNFRVRWWINSYQDTRIMFDRVNTALYKALNEAGFTIPFPQRDVHHKIDPVDLPQIAGAIRGTAGAGDK